MVGEPAEWSSEAIASCRFPVDPEWRVMREANGVGGWVTAPLVDQLHTRRSQNVDFGGNPRQTVVKVKVEADHDGATC